VSLYDLDDLKSVSDANLRERRRESSAAEAIAAEEAQGFLDWQKSQRAVPTVVALRQRAEEIRRVEIGKARRRMGALTEEQEKALEAVTSAIVNKLLHPPTVHLKELAKGGRSSEQDALVRSILGLG
jgi:glutamyl-tRNA reductase